MMPIQDPAGACRRVRYQITVQGACSRLPGEVLSGLHAVEELLPTGPVTVLSGSLSNSAALLDLLIGLHRAGVLLLTVTSLEHSQASDRTRGMYTQAANPEATA